MAVASNATRASVRIEAGAPSRGSRCTNEVMGVACAQAGALRSPSRTIGSRPSGIEPAVISAAGPCAGAGVKRPAAITTRSACTSLENTPLHSSIRRRSTTLGLSVLLRRTNQALRSGRPDRRRSGRSLHNRFPPRSDVAYQVGSQKRLGNLRAQMEAGVEHRGRQLLRNRVLDPKSTDDGAVMGDAHCADRLTKPGDVQADSVVAGGVRNWDDTVSKVNMAIEGAHRSTPGRWMRGRHQRVCPHQRVWLPDSRIPRRARATGTPVRHVATRTLQGTLRRAVNRFVVLAKTPPKTAERRARRQGGPEGATQVARDRKATDCHDLRVSEKYVNQCRD